MLLKRFADCDCTVYKINAFPFQSENLASSESVNSAEPYGKLDGIVFKQNKQLVNLFRVAEFGLEFFLLRQSCRRCRVCRDKSLPRSIGKSPADILMMVTDGCRRKGGTLF